MSSSHAATGRPGQPLWAIGGVLLCWIALRAALFEWPAAPPRILRGAAAETSEPARSPLVEPSAETARAGAPGGAPNPIIHPALPVSAGPVELGLRAPALRDPLSPPSLAPDSVQRAAGHNLLWMAAMGGLPLLPEVAAALAGAQPPAAPHGAVGRLRRGSRWSGDAWVAWRSGTSGLVSPASTLPVYGASQAGAVLRYDLAPASRSGAAAYIRTVGALADRREQDVAAGLAVRPLAGLPLTAHAELRLSRRENGTMLRPAAFVSGGVEDAPLAAGVTMRGYAQAGYVGGGDATAFADGSIVAERPLWRDRGAVLTAGAGAWGGAQRGAARLDLGPTASLRFRLGEATARVSADYRLRVAGNAEPASGAAVTLSTGF